MQKYLDVTGAAIYIKALVYKRISQIQLFNGDVEVSRLCMLKEVRSQTLSLGTRVRGNRERK